MGHFDGRLLSIAWRPGLCGSACERVMDLLLAKAYLYCNNVESCE